MTEYTLEELEAQIEDRFGKSFDEPILSMRIIEIFIYIYSIIFFVYHMWYAYGAGLPRSRHGIIHLGMILIMWALIRMSSVETEDILGKVKFIFYCIYALVASIPTYYFHTEYTAIIRRAGIHQTNDLLMGGLFMALTIIALWHISRLITAISIAGLFYAYAGPLFPGIIRHSGISIERIITMNTVEMSGLFGALLQTSATWVVAFLILAGMLEMYGGMTAFVKGATRVAARNRFIEIGQVAVASSMVMGSINGAVTANTATTGSFTIPLMKENGYRPQFAAAIESVASCGGQILPPIMGASAFVMAELIAPSYRDIIIASTLPAFIFFISTAAIITFEARKQGHSGAIKSEPESRSVSQRVWAVLQYYEYIIMFAVLLYYLIIVQADPMTAAFYSTIAVIILKGVHSVQNSLSSQKIGETTEQPQRRSLAPVKNNTVKFFRSSLEGIRRGAQVTVDITVMLASLGFVIRALIVTGFAQQLSRQIISIAAGELAILLLLTMVASILFGLGMSTVAAYMLVAILIAPSLTQVGVEPMTAHFYVFYFAILSNITPPIAIGVIIAAGIAKADFLPSCYQALKIGFPMYLLPFAFLFNDNLLYHDSLLVTGVVFLAITIAFIAIAISLTLHIVRPIPLSSSIFFMTMGLAIIFYTDLMIQSMLTLAIVALIGYHIREDIPRPDRVTYR